MTAVMQGVRILEVAEHTFADHGSLLANNLDAAKILRQAFGEYTLDEWRARLAGFRGQWAFAQHTLEAAADPQSVENGYVQGCETASGVPFRLVAAPVQFDE